MTRSYDVIVVGLGAMGSAAAYHLAGRGRSVLGLERFGPAHALGASHGGSRIYRQSYAEGESYVPLLLRARELWEQLNADSGHEVFTTTGGLVIGPQDSRMVAGSVRSAKAWDLAHEVLDSAEIRRRFPTFAPAADEVGFFEREAGVARPELTVSTHLDLAAARGAELHFEEPVLRWDVDAGGGVRVVTARATYLAERLVIAPGAWAPRLLADIGVPVRVERRVMYWFAPEGGTAPFVPEQHPVYVWEDRTGTSIYGFPALDGPDGGAKVAFHEGVAAPIDPDTLDRDIHPHEVEEMRTYLRTRIPTLAGDLIKGAACTYSLTPDEHFVVSAHPRHPEVTVACGFSGHGFKFVPVIGEILADLATDAATPHPIDLFDAGRPRTSAVGG
ncbi:N-methyl-L-tryptophan oxidase [Streptomyces sp. NPDC058579]|uniref:N-methyl-L-tryptophan oxidase n=1 Tax=Streptomyces sp. NPDC058579 TaxID=3346548 RepID=UPI003654B51F